MHLESVFDDLGGFGRYQRILISLFVLMDIVVVPTMLAMVIVGVEPDWWCEEVDGNGTSVRVNSTTRNCAFNGTCIRVFDDKAVTIVSEWELVCEKKWLTNTIISVQMAGVLVGALISGYCADTYGRKKDLYGGLLLLAVGNLVAAFSVSWVMFTILRFLLGMSVGILLPVLYLYMIEFVGTKWRGLIASLPAWAIGVLTFAVLAWWIRNWKWLHISLSILSVPFLLTWFVVPESIRWLTVKGRLEEARTVIAKMASVNNKPIPDTTILELVAEEERKEGDKYTAYNYLDLFKTKTLRRKTLITFYIWFSLSLTYYAISFGLKNLSGDFYINFMIMGVLELPSFFVMLSVAYMFGRRWACATLFILATLTCLGVAVSNRLAPDHLRVHLENGFAISAKVFTISAWGVSQALTSEQFPTVIRNLAVAAQNTVARFGGILASQVISGEGEGGLMAPFLAMGIMMLLTALSCFTLEETRKLALEDTMVNTSLEVTPEGQVTHGCCLTSSKGDNFKCQTADELTKENAETLKL